MLSLPFLTANNARRLSAQMDARDFPHQYCIDEILRNTNLELFGDGFIGHEAGKITLGPSCIKKNQGGGKAMNNNGALSSVTKNKNIQPANNGGGQSSNGKILKRLLVNFDQIITRIAERGKTVSESSTPSDSDSSHEPHIWISDWQIATHLAWGYAWPDAFKAGQDRAKTLLPPKGGDRSGLKPPEGTGPVENFLVKAPLKRRHPAALVVLRLYQSVTSRKEMKPKREINFEQEVDSTQDARNTSPWCNQPATIISEQKYQALTKAAQKEAEECQDTKKQYEEALDTATQKRSEYKSKALERAMQAMLRQGGEKGLEYVAQQEWQRLCTGSVIGRFCSDQGWVAQIWKKIFQDTCKEAWSKSWEVTWLAVWEDAYQLANSKGIEFGVGSTMRQRLNRKVLLESREKESYKNIELYIEQANIGEILNNVRSLIQDLNHISGLIAIHNVYTYDNRVTVRALVPNKNQDLEDMSRILPKQPVSRELSYMELKHFIIEQYFKKGPWQRRVLFKKGVSKSWEDFTRAIEES
ncbi:hypothetical protein RSOL_359580, partial [Rhizoctonia solani AG-3 Rhs1AP]